VLFCRYFFILHLKNPTAVQDDYWTMFMNMWVFGFVTLSEIVYHILPGKDNAKILVCYGKVPTELFDVPNKMNWHVVTAGYFTLFLHIAFGIFITMIRRYNKKKYKEFEQFKAEFGTGFSNDDLFMYAAAIACAITSILGIINCSVLDQIPPDLLDTYPYYIMVYILDEIHPSCVQLSTLAVIMLQQKKITKEFWQEVKNILP